MSWWLWDQILSATVLPICLLVGFFTDSSSVYYPQSFVSNANIVVNCYLHYKSDYILLFFNSWFIDEYFQHWFSIEALPRWKLTICFVTLPVSNPEQFFASGPMTTQFSSYCLWRVYQWLEILSTRKETPLLCSVPCWDIQNLDL